MLSFLKTRDVVVGIGTGLFVCAAWAAGAFAFHYAKTRADAALTPCSQDAYGKVTSGEKAYARRHWNEAEAQANDALTMSPKCYLAFELRGATKLQELLTQPRYVDQTILQAIRSDCYRDSSQAKKLGDKNPRNEATIRSCDADSVYAKPMGDANARARRHHPHSLLSRQPLTASPSSAS